MRSTFFMIIVGLCFTCSSIYAQDEKPVDNVIKTSKAPKLVRMQLKAGDPYHLYVYDTGALGEDPFEISDMIQELVDPHTWDSDGVGISIRGHDSIYVMQKPETQKKLYDLLQAFVTFKHHEAKAHKKKFDPKAEPARVYSQTLISGTSYDVHVYDIDKRLDGDDVDEIVDLIQEVVHPNSWDQDGIFIDNINGNLFVGQAKAAHKEIVTLLDKMRSFRHLQRKNRPHNPQSHEFKNTVHKILGMSREYSEKALHFLRSNRLIEAEQMAKESMTIMGKAKEFIIKGKEQGYAVDGLMERLKADSMKVKTVFNAILRAESEQSQDNKAKPKDNDKATDF